MAAEPLSPTAAQDYAAIEATLLGSERGRFFLAEHGRRARLGELAALAAAVDAVRERETFAEATLRRARDAFRPRAAEPVAVDRDGPDGAPEMLDISRAGAAFGDGVSRLSQILEAIADLAWSLRERGADLPWCDDLDVKVRLAAEACSRCEVEGFALAALASRLHAILDGGENGEDVERFSGDEAEPCDGDRSAPARFQPRDGPFLSLEDAFAAIDALSAREKLALVS